VLREGLYFSLLFQVQARISPSMLVAVVKSEMNTAYLLQRYDFEIKLLLFNAAGAAGCYYFIEIWLSFKYRFYLEI
jgi:hypothetical protein